MGYETRYKVTIPPEHGIQADALDRVLRELSGYDFEGGEPAMGRCKWYDHEEDLRALSARWPDILITAEGHGESPGDDWFKYFLGGKMQVCHAVVTYPPYDPKELK